MKRLLLPLLILCSSASAQVPPQLGKSPLTEVIKAMTTEEKVKLLVGMGFDMFIPGIPPMDPEDRKIPSKVPGAAGRTHAIARLGIPSLTLTDGPAGVRIDPFRNGDSSRNYYATGFPVASLLASTWDTALVTMVGRCMGNETKEYGNDIILAPAMNIHRNPLGGRNFEYYSEDPLLSGRMAAAAVKGIQQMGVGACIKHFVANNHEFNRMQMNVKLSQRALREIYLRGFEIAVKESQPWSLMSSYNLVNGVPTSENRDLLTTILRKEWGFKGLVMTDWFAGNNPVAQMNAGNDLIMPGNPEITKLIVKAVEAGQLSAAQLDENVSRVLQIILLSPEFRKHPYSNRPAMQEHSKYARQAAADGMVLLKNEDGCLPLQKQQKIALLGSNGYSLIAGGTGSGDVHKPYTVSLMKGLESYGFVLHPVKEVYLRHVDAQLASRPKMPNPFMLPPPLVEMNFKSPGLDQMAMEADVAVLVIGRNSGEFQDRKMAADFELTKEELQLMEAVAKSFHARKKKLVVVLNVAGVTETASWRRQADAILLTWQPGQEGGLAIADVLSGTVNPSGKLPASFPMLYDDVPSARNFPGKELPGAPPIRDFLRGHPSEIFYEEGIYTGYRYYSSFRREVAYEFGYGLSYTTFGYSGLKLGSPLMGRQMIATVTIKNQGNRAGREVVQLYIQAPGKSVHRPVIELKAFAKTRLLQPGESETLRFTLSPRDLAYFHQKKSSWMLEPGAYQLSIGASSKDIRQSVPFKVAKEVLVEQVNQVLAADKTLSEFKQEYH